jgi:beta propeller repeat protein
MKKNGGGRMKINKKLYSVTFASVALILFLILFSSAASAASPMVTETRMTTNPSNSENPVIYGNTIAWQDDRNGNWDIYIYDLSTRQELHTTNTSNQVSPDVYGNRVVWEDERNGGHDIYLQDLSTKKQTRITTSGKAINPAIYGDKIVWADGRNNGSFNEGGGSIGNWDIYMYDIPTSKETQITHNASDQERPDIFQDRIIWNEEGGIFLYNISTSKETRLTPYWWGSEEGSEGGADYYNGFPYIYGDKIVCDVETITGNYVSKMYDLSTSKETYLGVFDQSGSPAIYGNKIVFVDSYSIPRVEYNSDIYMYDLSTSEETHITTGKSSEKSAPAIYDNKIVWQDNRNGNWDIYMATLSSKIPVAAAFSASPTSGYAPLKVTFTDRSTGSPTSWKWSFGDSTYSTVKKPVHTYTKAGKYTVSLTVKSAAGSNTVTKSSFIVVNILKAPVAAFTASPTSGKAPLKVQFTDKSTNSPTSWKWSFGDGTYSTQKNPAHTYNKVGKYTVSLTAKNAKGSNTKTISGYITVKSK